MSNESPRRRLTKRQSDILALVAEGASNRAIAERLGISENGVKGHVARLLAKFDVPTRAALVGATQQPTDAAPSSPGSDTLDLVRRSLEEVIGTTATATLLRRASRHAGLATPETFAPVSMSDAGRVVQALWPLLIEMTGDVLVSRLASRGLSAAGTVDAREIAKWLR